MMAKSAKTPDAALPSVNQSAKWNSRIIENGFGFIFFVFGPAGKGRELVLEIGG
jgi:hypothetical protein